MMVLRTLGHTMRLYFEFAISYMEHIKLQMLTLLWSKGVELKI